MSELREMIEKTLKEMDALDVKISVEKYQEEIGANDKENIGVLSDGTRYYKKMVYKYLTENGYRMSPEYVEIAARKFPVNESNEEKITVNREKAVEHNDLQDVRRRSGNIFTVKDIGTTGRTEKQFWRTEISIHCRCDL